MQRRTEKRLENTLAYGIPILLLFLAVIVWWTIDTLGS